MKQILIGLTGFARTGKSTAASHLATEHSFETYAFMTPLKEGIAAMFNLSIEDIEGPGKEQPIDWLGRSPRQLMQLLGTEWGRDMISASIWLDLAEQNLGNLAELHPEAPGFVISDVRFENEADFVRKRGGLIVHVQRPDTSAVNPHVSELGVAVQPCDVVINNDADLADLFTQLDRLIAAVRAQAQHAA
ncbi:deoxynucleotide monophosphate kinase [Pseudomonas sp. LJDD11]|uniref:deoxynucleotide monophosphate kinase family protein n=1 Tax=Pseudomonas sp. LJDD11 TaxID=2931984 RepID=UPI00211CC24A|nr:deoxynucleotide monophosphate kinase [Pseudomonas sp. LJDD11]MCQ9422700.1 deoxynucleotide monophosphate kinase [Pseudomonas sp. LJDD11]